MLTSVPSNLRLHRIALLAISLSVVLSSIAMAQPASDERLALLEEQAMRAAVERVAPSVVRIETIGGLERVGDVLLGTGPTTGLIVSADGLIISSAFNFVQQPASIIVTLADGERLAARVVANDRSRMLTLLQVETETELPVPEFVPQDEFRVGQWAIAVGRTFELSQPSLSVGIVSAVERIWGKALQTDAKVSPINYGGPLIDIAGRVLGVLVPLSPQATNEVAGAEWYDSGIGFAVPLDHVQRVLPRLRSGQDLVPGLVGITLQDDDEPHPKIAAARVNSPAAGAGLKAGDRVVAVDDQAVRREADVKTRLNQFYAGDSVHLTVERDGERIEADVELVAELLPYARPFLGVLPQRTDDNVAGVLVRHVFEDSPAAQAGISPGDRITTVDGEPIDNATALGETLAARTPGDSITLTRTREGTSEDLELTLAGFSESVPGSLPPVERPAGDPPADRLEVGDVSVEVGEFTRDCRVYVPQDYDPRQPGGLLIYLHPPGTPPEQATLEAWQPLCDQYNVLLAMPTTVEGGRWTPDDLEFVRKSADEVVSRYQVDPRRIAIFGQQAAGSLAYTFAFEQRDLIRGVASVDAPLVSRPEDNDPLHPLSFYIASATDTPLAGQVTATIARLREAKFPVTERSLGAESRPLDDEQRDELFRWIDSLDRL